MAFPYLNTDTDAPFLSVTSDKAMEDGVSEEDYCRAAALVPNVVSPVANMYTVFDKDFSHTVSTSIRGFECKSCPAYKAS
jgi:hypothetical protein